VETATQVDAKKSTLTESDALKLAAEVDEIFVAKGKSVVHIHTKKDKPDPDTLKRLLLGPTGNLRAPALRVGRRLVVGFDEATYTSLFGKKPG
jgi:hypothetical protein